MSNASPTPPNPLASGSDDGVDLALVVVDVDEMLLVEVAVVDDPVKEIVTLGMDVLVEEDVVIEDDVEDKVEVALSVVEDVVGD